MPVTALTINGQNMLFMTTQRLDHEDIVDVDIHLADEDFLPKGTTSLGVANKNEETYHRELRKEAKERNQFVAEHSTNPEWNPE